MATSRPITTQESQLTLSLQGFHANQRPLPGSAEARKITVGSGKRLLELSKMRGHGGAFSRTLLEYLVYRGEFHSKVCYLRWRPWVTKSKRLLFRLEPRVPRIEGTEFGWLPTPQRADGANNGKREHSNQLMLCQIAGGPLNPQWIEWLMGYPENWTVLPESNPSATPSSRKSQRRSSKPSKNPIP